MFSFLLFWHENQSTRSENELELQECFPFEPSTFWNACHWARPPKNGCPNKVSSASARLRAALQYEDAEAAEVKNFLSPGWQDDAEVS